jgi:hypothetical protein
MLRRTSRAALALAAAVAVLMPMTPRDALASDRAPSPRWGEISRTDGGFRGCRRVAVRRGIAVSCRIPATATAAEPLVLTVVPLAGDDQLDGGLGRDTQVHHCEKVV